MAGKRRGYRLPGQGLPGHHLSKRGHSTVWVYSFPPHSGEVEHRLEAWEEARLRGNFGSLSGKTSLYFVPRKSRQEEPPVLLFQQDLCCLSAQGKSCLLGMMRGTFRSGRDWSRLPASRHACGAGSVPGLLRDTDPAAEQDQAGPQGCCSGMPLWRRTAGVATVRAWLCPPQRPCLAQSPLTTCF